jgi:hypothetical protein
VIGVPEHPELIPTTVDDPRDTKHLENVLERALLLIGSAADKRIDCDVWVRSCIVDIRYANFCPILPDAQIKGELAKLAAALKKLNSVIDNLSPCTFLGRLNYDTAFRRWSKILTMPPQTLQQPIGISWVELKNDLDTKISFIEKVQWPTRRGSPRVDYAKIVAAASDFLLLSKFGMKRPTLTIGGPFYELASVLYEGATYIPEANLERYCRGIAATATAQRLRQR